MNELNGSWKKDRKVVIEKQFLVHDSGLVEIAFHINEGSPSLLWRLLCPKTPLAP